MSLPEFLSKQEHFSWLMGKVSVDHDNTISNTKGIVTEKFNEEFGTNHQVVELAGWRAVAGWARDLGMSNEEALAVNHRFWFDTDLINLARPNPGAIEFLERANRTGELIINSSRPYEQLGSTRAWYRQYAPFISPEQIIVGLPDIVIAGDILSQAISKTWVIKTLGSRSHIEDVSFHAKTILDYTDAFIFLLSDDTALDTRYQTRLMRFGGKDGKAPDMSQLARLIVAQSY